MKRTMELPLKDGGSFVLEYASPALLLEAMLEASVELQRLWAHALGSGAGSQANPFRIVLAFDEFTPGNLLQGQHRRKVMVVSMSWIDLGQRAISEGPCWISPLVCRSCMLDKIVGGFSHVLRKPLEYTLFGPEGLSTVGLTVCDTIVFSRLSAVLSDGDGLRQALSWRGASGLKPCFRHFNL